MTRIPEFQNYVVIDFYTHIMDVGAIFTSPNHPMCEYIRTSADRACKTSHRNFELSRFYCIGLLNIYVHMNFN